MPDPEWKTVRLRAAKHAAISARAKADGLSVAEWLDRTLGAALAGPDPAPASVVAPSAYVPAPRRASAKRAAPTVAMVGVVVKSAAERVADELVAKEAERQRMARRR